MANDGSTQSGINLTSLKGQRPGPPPEPDITPPDKSLFYLSRLDVPYATQSEAQKLDLFLPSNGHAPYPVIVRIHGGGFHIGDKQGDMAVIANPVLGRG